MKSEIKYETYRKSNGYYVLFEVIYPFYVSLSYIERTRIDPNKHRNVKISKSTLWHQKKKIKEGNTIKRYNKTKVKIN